MKDINNFISTVESMRNAQKEYFRTRNKEVMKHSIILEKTVDKMIAEHKNELKKNPIQQELFPHD